MIDTPALVLSIILASAYGLAFFLWRGHTVRDLLFFWLAAVVGFAAGQIAGQLLDILPWTLGQVHIIEATVIAVLFLVIATWLKQDDHKK